MGTYAIENTTTGLLLGAWTADNERGALDAMARDSGYSDADAAEDAIGHDLNRDMVVTRLDGVALEVNGVDGDTFATDAATFLDANQYDLDAVWTVLHAILDGSAVGGGGAAPEYTVRVVR